MSDTNPDMQRNETAEVSEDSDRTTEAPADDYMGQLNESAYAKHLWLIKENTDLRVRNLQLERENAELRQTIEDVCGGAQSSQPEQLRGVETDGNLK
jgi:hypothetical protein